MMNRETLKVLDDVGALFRIAGYDVEIHKVLNGLLKIDMGVTKIG